MKWIGWTVIIGVILLILHLGGSLVGGCNNATQVARKEFYPDALLRKYEWFKDAAAQLDNKLATLKVYDARVQSLRSEYGQATREHWAREDREQLSIWQSERAGIAASYNSLAADYNAQMAKFNWRFTNVGDLPDGASTPLPRAFKPYLED